MYVVGPILLSEPAGLLALLGVPIALVIFFFHRQAKRIPISTLFLISKQNSTDSKGRKFERIKNSISLWMTLLVILLLTLVLTKPLFISENYAQKIVVVLDSSVSMRAFLPDGLAPVRGMFDKIDRLSSKTEWVILESSTHTTPLYEGSEVSEASKSLENWKPDFGTHYPRTQLEFAQTLAGSTGMVLFISDRPVEVPVGITLMAIGSIIENVGFVGTSEHIVDSGEVSRSVLIKNYSASIQNRTLVVGNVSQQNLVLSPNQIVKIDLPNNFTSDDGPPIELHLNKDRFPLDDVQLIIKKKPKILRAAILPTDARYGVLRRILAIESAISIVDSSSNPDVVIGDSILTRKDDSRPTLYFPPPRADSEILSRSPITAVHHPLTEGLQFEGLIVPPCRPFSPHVGDKVLVWQGDIPMIIALRGGSLYFNFDSTNEKSSRHPALVVLLHRYLSSIRKALVAPETKSFDGGQLLDLPVIDGRRVIMKERSMLSGENSERIVFKTEVQTLRAPVVPSLFFVETDGIQLVTGVSNFADTRESDFSDAVTIIPSLKSQQQNIKLQAQRDPFRSLWIVGAIVAALASWIPVKDVLALLGKRR